MCIGTSTNAKTFRTQCRALNNAYTFGSFAINYGEVCQLPIPSSLKINGIPYSLLFHGEVKCPLTYYIHDANYRHNPKLPEYLHTVVTDCIFQLNDLANKLKVLGQLPNVDAWTLHIDINDAATASAGDVAGLVIKSSGADVNGRTLVIYPTQASFQRAHPTLETTRGENGLFVPSNHELYEPLQYVMFAPGGMQDKGYSTQRFITRSASGSQKELTLLKYARYRALGVENMVNASNMYLRDASGCCIIDQRWFASTQTGLMWPHCRDARSGDFLVQKCTHT